jgi:hypothetical protein
MIVEPARTPRRPRMERRPTIAYPVSRQITYPYESGRRRDLIDEPLSPVLTRQCDSPGFSRRRERWGPPPEWYYLDELGGKDRALDDYVDPMERENRFREDDLRRREERSRRRESKGPPPEWYYPDELARKAMRRENRFWEKDLKRQERTLDERDAIKGRGSSKGFYGSPRDGWDRR